MDRLIVAGKTEVLIDNGRPGRLLPDRPGRTRVAILTQPAATPLALDLTAVLESQGLVCEVIGLPDRDEAKTLEVAGSVYEALASFGLSRFDTILGVGGGSATDLAGFVGGTWLRGVEVVHMPTTLLGAVDAAIGGKTGINVAGKNLVGVFWNPSRVIIDVDQLSRLPAYLIREGMAEAYKAGLVGDAELAELIHREGLSAPLQEVVTRAVRVKAEIVSRDYTEQGVRAHLNFGHTIGHALEFGSPLSHGECVGLGMVAAARISEKLADFPHSRRVTETVGRLGLPVRVDGLDLARLHDLLTKDKKRDASGLRMVLLRNVGDPYLAHVDSAFIDLGLAAIGL